MKTIKEMIEVMQAYDRGEQIQVKTTNKKCDWEDVKEPYWQWNFCDYRVKPKKYVPFDTAEEFLAAQREHGSSVKVNSIDKSVFYAKTGENNIELSAFVNSDGCIALIEKGYRTTQVFELLALGVDFADGTPCGKEVEE